MSTARTTSSQAGMLGSRDEGVLSPGLPGRHEDQRGWSQEDDPERRKDAADHRKHHLQRCLGGLFLSALAALAPHLVSLNAQDLADAGAELLGLDDGLDEVCL